MEKPFIILYHPKIVSEDIPLLNKKIKDRIKLAIEVRLLNEPIKYGLPLKRSLKGYRKMRVGDYRIIYNVVQKEIRIVIIGHRKDVYSRIIKRLF